MQCGNLSRELLLLTLWANGAPCPPFSVPLSPTFFLSLSHTGCQAALTMNQSLGGFFDCRWGAEVTPVRVFCSLSAVPCVRNNSLTYHFFLMVGEKSLSLWWQILMLPHMINTVICIILPALHYN